MLAVDTNELARDDERQAKLADEFVAKGAWWCWQKPCGFWIPCMRVRLSN